MSKGTNFLGDLNWEDSTSENGVTGESIQDTAEPIISTSNIELPSGFFDNIPEEQVVDTPTTEETPTTEVVSTEETASTEESTDTNDTSEEIEEPSTQPSFNELVTMLVEKGTINGLPEDLELEDSIEGVSTLINKEKENYFTSKLNSLSEATRKAVELELKGVNPEDVFDEDYVDYQQIDLEDPDNHENLLKEFYVKTGIYSEQDENLDTKIQNKLKNLDAVVLNETLQEAVSYLANKQKIDLEAKEALAIQKAELSKKEQELEDRKKFEEFKSKITSIRNIKGLEVSQQDAEELFNYMTVRDSKGKTQAEKDQTEEAWLFLEYVKMKKIDLNSLNRKAITTATKQIEKKLLKITPKSEQNNITVTKEKEIPLRGIPFSIN